MRLVRDYGDGIQSVQFESTGTYGLMIDGKDEGEYACHGCANHRAFEILENRRRPSAWAMLQAAVAERRIERTLERFEGNDDQE